ncbi:malonate decarboxylase subunit epsilon [Trinickia dinghuensis]|uniref:Malonyl CoA-acyl carrier protein transacylase n=1 Tax=Trinickia dinghuensis TaxID=2291023 RepID=A0A3D8JZN4_9BURK|nr:malonate decarboxylase subunit epsilon [Trinickia dinghuensis]RDU98623.1 malonate decarboxylase subunit epsilon [Trinickia dinghuensis]
MLALLYPGQGAQSAGFLHRLPNHPVVASTIDEASAALSLDVMALDSSDALRSSIAVQITLVVAGVATARRLVEAGIEAELHAGLSVGAYAAAVGCGSIDFADALRMVKTRAELMERAYPSGYGLSAIEGLTEAQVEALIDTTAAVPGQRVYVANVNAPRQIVVAGADAALEAFNERAREAGAHRAKRLAVSVPSHCELLQEASDTLVGYAADIAFGKPKHIYIGNRRARALHKGEDIREDLATNMRYTVRWFDALTTIIERGTTVLVEAPPGQVLTDIARIAYPEIMALAAASFADDRLVDVVSRRVAGSQ